MIYQHKDGGLFEIAEDDGVTVRCFPQGGGPQYAVPREKFFADCSPAPAPALRRGRVDADWIPEGETLPCWSDDRRWNGWGMPFFPREAVDKLVEQSSQEELQPMRWDGDVVVVQDVDEGEDVRYAPTTMPDGSQAWDIGSGWWCWNSVQFDGEAS